MKRNFAISKKLGAENSMYLKSMKCGVILCLLFFAGWFYPDISFSALAVHTEIISGTIIEKNEDDSITLDNQIIYYPSRKDLSIPLSVGESVTLRYTTDEYGKNTFFDFAQGHSSLKETPATLPRKGSLQ